MTIIDSYESERGCGFRKKGGIYLIAGNIGSPCCKLPFELTVCPTCSAGIKPTRGFTWINSAIFNPKQCTMQPPDTSCPMNEPNLRMGLLWVGGKFYKNADDFVNESKLLGISRRISQVPKDLVIGQTQIALAHRDCIPYEEKGEDGNMVTKYKPAIFQTFTPTRLDYVVKGDETTEELERLEKRGFALVNVIPKTQATIVGEEEEV